MTRSACPRRFSESTSKADDGSTATRWATPAPSRMAAMRPVPLPISITRRPSSSSGDSSGPNMSRKIATEP